MSQQELGYELDEDICAVVTGCLMTLEAVKLLHELQERRDDSKEQMRLLSVATGDAVSTRCRACGGKTV